jgi:putative glycosyltransferase (TIGR04372 family)
MIAATPRPAWLSPRSNFNGRYESRYYPLIAASPAPPLHVGSEMRGVVSRALTNRFGTEFGRRCAFYVRYLKEFNDGDTSSLNRLSAPLEAYLPAVRVLNRRGFQVLLTGDALAPPGWADEMPGAVVDWRSAGVDPNAFRLFAGTEVDIHIGMQSGGSAFVCITDIPALMLNGFPPGDALPRTTVSYKWLYGEDGAVVGLDRLLSGTFYDHQLHGCRLVENSPEEMAETVEDFIAHCGERPYGVDPAELGIEAPWIRAANARLSPVWLRQHSDRLQAKRVRLVADP